VPVFPFAYDWRADNRVVADRLCDFVREVIDRTNLLKSYAKEKATTVDVVGHSMGGLIIASALAKGCKGAHGNPLVRRVVTIGTPFQGAVDAVIKLATGEGSMVGSPQHSERLAARMTPAIYHLLPYFEGALAGHSGKAIFNDSNWQESIVESIADFIRTHSTDPRNSTAEQRMESARRYLRERLADGRSFLRSVNLKDPRTALAEPGQWLLIVGLDERTAHRVRLANDGRFAFDVEPREYRGEDGVPAEIDARRGNLGDGTVPLRGAVPEWADPSSVVGVAERDFGGFLGVGENLPFRKGMTLHAALPLMNLVQRWTISFLRGERWGDLWGRPLPGAPIQDWQSPVAGARPEHYSYQKPD
jgi:pimeloyl-ACP methyl ester carboxylesterase